MDESSAAMSNDSSETLHPPSDEEEEEIEFIKVLAMHNKLRLKHGYDMLHICNLGPVGIRDNAELISAHLQRMIVLSESSLSELEDKSMSILGEEGTSQLINEADGFANEAYSEWQSDQTYNESDRSLGPTTNQKERRRELSSPTVLFREESRSADENMPEGSESMSRDSMSTEGDGCESVDGSRKRRQSHTSSSQQQKKRPRRTTKESDNTIAAFAQKERELERRKEEMKNREKALAEKEKQLLERQAAAEVSSRKSTLEKQTRLEAEHQQNLDMATAEAEKRLLQIQEETKAETERLAKIQHAKAEAERKAAEEKEEAKAVIEKRLVVSRHKIEGLSSAMNKHHVVVVAVSLLDAVVRKVEDALDPSNPNLALIPKITNDLIIILQVIAKFKKMLGKCMTKKEARSIETLLDINVSQSIGAIAARIEKNKADKEEAINYQVPDGVKHLKYALHRFKTGGDCTVDLDSQVTSTDINKIKAAFKFDQAAENLLLNCIHISLMVYVEESLTVEQLYKNHGDSGLRRAKELWEAVQSGMPFNAKETSMLEFRQQVLLPALANEKSRDDAVKVNCDFANYLTDLRIGGRGEIVRPAFDKAQRKKFDGSDGEECKEDYCAGSGDKLNKRRGRITLLQSNLSAPDAIQQRLPGDLFPGGFSRALLLNSSSFCKESCNFVSRGDNNKPGFFERGHDIDETVKGIQGKLKYTNDVGEKNIIIVDREEQQKLIDSLQSLFS